MTPQRHSLLARQLIERCGGLCASSEATRLQKSRLSDFQNPNLPDAVMPADVIYELERLCGDPLYSRALYDAARYDGPVQDALEEACDATETAAELQRLLRGLKAAGKPLGEQEKRAIAFKLTSLLDEVQGLAEAIDRPVLQVVGGGEP